MPHARRFLSSSSHPCFASRLRMYAWVCSPVQIALTPPIVDLGVAYVGVSVTHSCTATNLTMLRTCFAWQDVLAKPLGPR